MNPNPGVVALLSAALGSVALAQSTQVSVRAELGPTELTYFAFSLAEGPPVRIPGVDGVLRLDPATLVVLMAPPPDSIGISTVQVPVPAGWPDEDLHCQTVRVCMVHGDVVLEMRTQPLVDRHVADFERNFVLGQNTGGEYLFDLSAQDIIDTVQHYHTGTPDPAPVLTRMRRPFDRVTCSHLHEVVGLNASCDLLAEFWRLALQRSPIATIDDRMRNRAREAELNHEARIFPNGIPPDDEYWDTWLPAGTDCASRMTFADDGAHRLTTRASVNHWCLKTDVCGITRMLLDGATTGYVRFGADSIGLTGSVTRGGVETRQLANSRANASYIRDATGWFYTGPSHYDLGIQGSGRLGATTLACDASLSGFH
ncbi:MAG: hypothetical protein IPM29_18645 [Planctomycetes bacterium]|nr:hypothetical protein [Planctomycetota bacterium]